MPVPAFMWIKDDQGNEVKGSVKIEGREGSIEVQQFEHELRIPTDPHTGQPAGIRQHEMLKLVKQYDSSSPLLYKACANGQNLKEVIIRWYTIDDTGGEVEYFTHKLENAKITSVRPFMPHTKDLSKERFTHLEEVAFSYSSITWTYVDGNIEYTDSFVGKR